MWQKSIKNFVLPIILLFSFILSSCIEEPFIDPVKRPYSVIRVSNFSSNVAAINVTIDGTSPAAGLANLGISSFTGYFDINSGTRKFLVKNVATGDTVFNKNIEIASYEIATIAFAGFFSTDKLINSFGNVMFEEGQVYQNTAPKTGTLNVFIINAAASIDTLDAKKLTILTKYKHSDSTNYVNIENKTGLEFNKIHSITNKTPTGPNLFPGNYLLDIKDEKGLTVMEFPSDSSFNASAGMRYYMFIYGPPNNIKAFLDEQIPQPVRPK